MKKLLMKWFPSYFNVCKHYELDFEKLEGPNSALKIQVVDEETANTFEKLGISPERGEFLERETKKCMIDHDSRIATMKAMEKHVKHINEFYMVSVLMMEEANGGLPGFIQHIMQRGGGRPPEE